MAETCPNIDFTIEEALKVINWELLSHEDRQALINKELDALIQKLISEGRFNLTNLYATIEASPISILSTVTDAELIEYMNIRDWKIEKKVRVLYNVKVPTFMYIIEFDSQANKEVQFLLNGEWKKFGTTNNVGQITTNLAEYTLQFNVFPTAISEAFRFKIDDTEYEIPKTDTNYQYITVKAQTT